jgi:hypothetical protein
MKVGIVLVTISLFLAQQCRANETITSLSQIDDIVFSTQEQFWQLIPPADDPLYVHPDELVRAVDWKSKEWPKAITRQMYAEMRSVNGSMYPVYRMTVVEARDGDLVYYNCYDQEIWRMEAPTDYNPYLFALIHFDVASTLDLTSWQLEWGRSSNIGAEILLLPESFMNYYEQDVAYEAQALSLTQPMSMMMSLPATVSNLVMAINATNGVAELDIGWPASFTNDLEIFATSDLVEYVWDVIHTGITTTSTNKYEWTDSASTNFSVRFYIAGNADIDSDGDSLSDAREVLMYSSLTNTNDSDGDGLTDDVEVGASPPTAPYDDDTQAPVITITSPVNNILVVP